MTTVLEIKETPRHGLKAGVEIRAIVLMAGIMGGGAGAAPWHQQPPPPPSGQAGYGYSGYSAYPPAPTNMAPGLSVSPPPPGMGSMYYGAGSPPPPPPGEGPPPVRAFFQHW